MSLFKEIRQIRSRLSGLMLQDRNRISARLDRLSRRPTEGGDAHGLPGALRRLHRQVASAQRKKEERLARMPDLAYAENLPIFGSKNDIVRAVRNHPVVIVSGETGSGKSTQIPKMCLEAGRGLLGRIGCTQPRRIAATTVARRIAEELGEPVGKSVGYKIRFTDRTHPEGFIKIVTDGMLLAETQKDPSLYEYDTIIVDEAHERSLNIDFLLGLLRLLLVRRNDLKVIITSATLDTEKFSAAFGNAPVIEVKGRLYPVEVRHMPLDPDLEASGDVTYVDMAVRAVEEIRTLGQGGDILMFMPTEQDIRETCELLEGRRFRGAVIFPLFARLTSAQQKRVFADFPGQKIVVATNVAETSVTIPGIRYVIDTGLARIPRYVPRTRTTSMPVCPVSRSSADQRKGRCGRVREGVCIRLYSESDYESRPDFTEPEILRSNLSEVILRMLALNLGHAGKFPFIDPPSPKSVKDGYDLLLELAAVRRAGDTFDLTDRGRAMSRMPLDPQVSRMLLEARSEGCVPEMAVIAAGLSIQDPRERPMEKSAHADQVHAPFKDSDSDFLTLLNIWRRYHRESDTLKTQNRMRRFCRDNYLSFVRMREWRDVHEQITSVLAEQGIPATREDAEEAPVNPAGTAKPLYAAIHRSVLSGYLSNIAVRKEKNIYLAAKGRKVMIFPGSTLFHRGPRWIVAAELVKTTQLFARTAARIDPNWLEDIGAGLCRRSYSQPHWEKDREEVVALERVTLHGLPIVERRPVPYGQIQPEEAHGIFVQSALVEGAVKGPPSFLRHNLNLMNEVSRIEDKIRRRGLRASDQTLAQFYSDRIPGVCSMAQLRSRIALEGGDGFLKMKESDLLTSVPDANIHHAYPEHLTVGGDRFPFSYRYSPGADEDGLTISIPSTLAARFPEGRLDWLVPGMLREKITALIKGLPKRYRKQLVPINRAADIVLAEMEWTDEPLVTALSRFIQGNFGLDIPSSEWAGGALPDYLKMRVSLTDHSGREMRSGRDLHRLREEAALEKAPEAELEAWKRASAQWERSGITCWDVGSLPERITLGPHLAAFPALEPEDGSVRIRLFSDADEAQASHRRGVAALFTLHLAKDLRFTRRFLTLPDELAKACAYFGGRQEVDRRLYDSLLLHHFHVEIRTEADFLAHAEIAKSLLASSAQELLALAAQVLRAYAQTRKALAAVESANRSNTGLLELCRRVRKELEALVQGDFLAAYSWERLRHLPRYLKAVAVRAERAAYDPEKDRKKAMGVDAFVAALAAMAEGLSAGATRQKKEALEAFRWMLEEFKVSQFAPELKTPFPVSAKRLREKAEEIRRMV